MSPQGRRSKFPLHNGYLVLLSKYETQNIEVKVSYNTDPQSVADFSHFLKRRISNYGVGFTCFKIPDAPQGMDAGANATFQMRLESNYETPLPRSYFSCADITYVEREGLDFPFPCVNTTDVEWEILPTPTKKQDPPGPTATPWSPTEEKGKKKLSSGAIAGICIGGTIVLSGIVVLICKAVMESRESKERQKQVPCRWEPGSYGLPDLVPVNYDVYGTPTRRG
ncbi:uncharacterized protein TrAtP1_011522 [Trichoderma atroviride]|uniref:uncharacterized protein n=1 Tax=Hypocrea atroviridis TaxID=63577 RepID=UPI00332BE9B6|nr:hypothetical protein TrAtP1_011522 [Trichoderma atroviride]